MNNNERDAIDRIAAGYAQDDSPRERRRRKHRQKAEAVSEAADEQARKLEAAMAADPDLAITPEQRIAIGLARSARASREALAANTDPAA